MPSKCVLRQSVSETSCAALTGTQRQIARSSIRVVQGGGYASGDQRYIARVPHFAFHILHRLYMARIRYQETRQLCLGNMDHWDCFVLHVRNYFAMGVKNERIM